MICEICTRKCTRNARFHTDFGRFLCVFGNGNRVQQKQNEARRQNRASTLFPMRCKGLSQQCGAKIQSLYQILAYGCKQFAQPCQYWFPVPHEQDKNGND